MMGLQVPIYLMEILRIPLRKNKYEASILLVKCDMQLRKKSIPSFINLDIQVTNVKDCQ